MRCDACVALRCCALHCYALHCCALRCGALRNFDYRATGQRKTRAVGPNYQARETYVRQLTFQVSNQNRSGLEPVLQRPTESNHMPAKWLQWLGRLLKQLGILPGA